MEVGRGEEEPDSGLAENEEEGEAEGDTPGEVAEFSAATGGEGLLTGDCCDEAESEDVLETFGEEETAAPGDEDAPSGVKERPGDGDAPPEIGDGGGMTKDGRVGDGA